VGRNTIKAGNGNDRLDGGYGSDALTGGSGKDVFVFKDKLSKSANLDRILDYKVADDTIHLENAIFRKLTKTGVLNKNFFASGPKAKDKNDYIVYDKGTGYLYYDADGSGKGKAVAFAKLAAGLKMASSEFKVI
jgi:Ca2+-binding RTX toxin-like protein